MGSESVGSSGPNCQPAGAFREEEQPLQGSPVKKEHLRDYQREARADNAKKSPRTPEAAGGAAGGGRGYAEVLCPCGQGPCVVRTSRTEKNPGRDFYTCPAKPQCGYFLWCDIASCRKELGFGSPVKCNEQHAANSPIKLQCGVKSPVKQQCGFNTPMKPDQKKCAMESARPTCSCGAGPCLILTKKDGDNAGRRYYACHIPKGHGACSHFQWLDSPAKLSETKERFPSENKVSSAPVAPGEQKKPETGTDAENCHLNHEEFLSFALVNEELKEAEKHSDEAQDTMNDAKPEQVLTDASVVPESPLLSPKRVNEFNNVEAVSPMKRLGIHNDSPVAFRSGKCYSCGKEGHWASECPKKSTSPCYKCGVFGHWQKDCNA